jgi:hypothetical protein
LHSRLRGEAKRRRTEYADRGALTIQDGYNTDAFARVVRACWRFKTEAGIVRDCSSPSVLSGLRTAVDLLFAHNMLLRGETRRNVQLPDLFPLALNHEGPSPCTALILIIDQGKKNQFGKIEYGCVVRHRELRLCTIAHLAAYLVYRWDVAGEAAPRFQRRQQWYDTFLLLGQTPLKPLSYETQLQWTNDAFGTAKLSSLKKTHAGRAQGAKQAELDGVEEAQIRRAGRWNQDVLSNCYLSHLPRSFVRSMAGFDPSRPGNYFVPRTKVQPPRSLAASLWPWVDEWQAWFAAHATPDAAAAAEPASYAHIEFDTEGEDRCDLAAQGFLALLAELRTAFLQDSVFLRHEYPHHPLWRHAIFARPEYQSFALDVELACQDVEEPYEIRLRNALLEVAIALNNVRAQLHGAVERWGGRTTRDVQEILQRLDDLCRTRTITTTTVVQLDSEGGPPLPPAASSRPAPRAARDAGEAAPRYEMDRTVQAVPSLWREWTEGLEGGPAVAALEEQYGSQWRPRQKDRTFFFRRKLIVGEVQRRVATRLAQSEAEAVEQLEALRQEKGLTLNKLSLWIEQRKQRGRETQEA